MKTVTDIEKVKDLIMSVWPLSEPVPYVLTEKERKYKFGGMLKPSQVRKANAYIERTNLANAARFKKESAERDGVIATFDSLKDWPEALVHLFTSSVYSAVERVTQINIAHKRANAEFESKYGKAAYENLPGLWYRLFRSSEPKASQAGRRAFGETEWKHFVTTVSVYDAKTGAYVRPLESISDWQGLVKDAVSLRSLRAADELRLGEVAYANAVRHVAHVVRNVVSDVSSIFDGAPDGCETSPNWGVGGKFDCVVTKGPRRISFCSFFAGGHTVQRLHIRYKVTELKPMC